MEELRDRIWDFLYQAGQPTSVEATAASMGCDQEAVRLAVDHDWFEVTDGQIQIAFSAPKDCDV